MSKFRDAQHREWVIEFDFGVLRRIKKIAHVDLLEAQVLQTVGRDLCAFVDVVYAAVQPQADARKVTDLEFGRLMVDCIDAAAEAFFEELEHFFRRLGRMALATLIQQILQTVEEAKAQETERARIVAQSGMAQKVMEQMKAETQKLRKTLPIEIDRAIAGAIASDSPASSDSTSSSSID